jgi:hypothetical protein
MSKSKKKLHYLPKTEGEFGTPHIYSQLNLLPQHGALFSWNKTQENKYYKVEFFFLAIGGTAKQSTARGKK